jgi:hypothetical protein
MTLHNSQSYVNSYPISEQRLSDVERGRSCDAILPLPPGQPLAAGDSILFEIAHSAHAKGGDSVRVILTAVTDLGTTDSATGRALLRVSWEPLGRSVTPDPTPKHVRRHRWGA